MASRTAFVAATTGLGRGQARHRAGRWSARPPGRRPPFRATSRLRRKSVYLAGGGASGGHLRRPADLRFSTICPGPRRSPKLGGQIRRRGGRLRVGAPRRPPRLRAVLHHPSSQHRLMQPQLPGYRTDRQAAGGYTIDRLALEGLGEDPTGTACQTLLSSCEKLAWVPTRPGEDHLRHPGLAWPPEGRTSATCRMEAPPSCMPRTAPLRSR